MKKNQLLWPLSLLLAILILSSCDKGDSEPGSSVVTWENTYSEFGENPFFGQLVQSADNGYVIGAGEFVFKLNERGTVEWSTSLNGMISYILPTKDQGFLLVGRLNDMENSTVLLWCCKIDDSGSINWEKSFETDQGDYGMGLAAVQNSDEGFSIVGQTGFNYDLPLYEQDQIKLWVINLETNGTKISESFLVAYDLPKYYFSEVLIPTDRSGYILAGEIQLTSGHPILFKMDNNGTLKWDYSMEPGFWQINSIIEAADGGIIFAGSTQVKAWVFKFNSSGSLVWENYYGEGEKKHWAYAVSRDSDGYILAGFTNAKGVGLDDIWIFKLDDAGNMIWDQTYGSTGYDNAVSIRPTSDKGYAAAGYIQVSDLPTKFDIWVGKMDDMGQIEK